MSSKMVNTILIAIAIIAFWGLSSFFLKIAVDKLGAVRALFWGVASFVIIDIFIFALLLYYKVPTNFEFHSWTAMLAGILSAGGFFAYYWLLQRMKVSVAVPLTALFPALTVVLAVLILKEKIKLVNGIGILLALAAAVLLAL